MIDKSKVSNIPCRLHNVGEGGVAGADEVIDDNKGKSQQQINAEVDQTLGSGGSVDERIAAAVAPKANSTDVYAKSETYNKSELNSMITTPEQGFVTVTATDETTDVTDVLPATGAADTVYRVGNWDGSQFDETVYSEYAWNGSQYVHLSTKTQIGEVFDISAYHATGGTLATYDDLAAALGTNGANIPVSLRKGGMSVKFVQTSNKYVQFHCISDEFTTDTDYWLISNDNRLIDTPEFINVETDAEDKILSARKTDGTKVEYADVEFKKDLKVKKTQSEILDIDGSTSKAIENPEYINIKTDAEDKILEATKNDGTKIFNKDVEVNGAIKAKEVEIGGKKISEAASVEVMDLSDDPEERLEIKTDSEDKIVSQRDPDGTLVEYVGVKTNKLHLTSEGMTDFQQALKDSGFQPGGSGDYTDKDSMYIPEPRLAHLNIITDFDLTALTKTSDVKCQVEFTDGAGNYFKKWIILNGQGRSSLSFMKKGLGADFFNEDTNSPDFNEDNVFSMKFGDWVPQDSFHIKSYYTDWPRCTSPVVYKLTDEVVKTRGVMNDRPYKKYYVGEYSDAANANTQSDLDKNMETGARCFPDGFPVIVYQNGEFWGVNAWQLKKHRDNYAQSKKKATHIHLDGDMGISHWNEVTPPQPTPWVPFWLWNGTINWAVYCSGKAGIETRNPKNLYCIDGKKYDADTHDAEIITTATAEEWIAAGKIIPTDKPIDDTLAGYLRTTGKVRKSIEDLTTYVPTINQMISDGATTEEIRATIADMFDINSFIDYILIGNVCGNNDAWDNNGQIITWGKLDGSSRLNWSVNMYDCDITFGCQWDGRYATAANNSKLGATYPLYKIFWDYYYDELKARYHELRDKGIFDADHITQLFRNWMDRVGYDNYSKEYEKWNESPCFRDGSQTYTNYPTTGGMYGSIYRIYLWIKKRIEFMDASDFFDYNQQ